MTDHLPARRSAWDLVRMPREVARALTQAEQSAAVQAARIEAVSYVTATGYQAVANLSDLEARLITRSPLAEARLRFIGDTGAARIAEIIERTRP
ncbi:MAG: hypothetical protein ACJ74O_02800 [Frankiaceae bacterium]